MALLHSQTRRHMINYLHPLWNKTEPNMMGFDEIRKLDDAISGF